MQTSSHSRKRAFCAIFLITVGSASAEMRTFTSPDGRTMQAEIVSATVDRVTLKTAAGQTLVAPNNKFSEADQAFITQWRKDNPETIKYRFTADYTKSKISSSKRSGDTEFITTEIWECNMKLMNQSGQTLQGVSVDYVIYFERLSSGNMVTQSKAGKVDIGTMNALQPIVLKTDTVELYGYQIKPGYYYDDGTRARDKETIKGMVINVNHEGKKVFTWASSGVPKGSTEIGAGTSAGTKGSIFGK
jgi:hypothetical protein